MTTDGRLVRGERTRTTVLDTAVVLATEAGLDGLSLGQLADRLGVSKSGLFAHWRSKEQLQLATIEHARQQWVDRVIGPALHSPRGVRRLWALHEGRLAFYAADVLPGGCFFASTLFEYNARPGPVRDRLAATEADWLALLERLITAAVSVGELAADTDVQQLAYELEAIGMAAALQSRLVRPDDVFPRARRAVLDRLRAGCPDPTLLPEA